jgi:LuxR family transcriptional regulator, maltose regulon positive regulatory protein
LREMLGNAGWVRVAGGRSCLEPAFVWSDAQALWQACATAEEASRKGDVAASGDAAGQLMQLYRGDLLAGDEEAPWLLGARERLRSAFVRSVRSVAKALQGRNKTDIAIALIERALAAEPLAEELAQQLIGAYLELGQPTEAMRVYRSLRQMLSVTLGRQPAAATERLRQSILDQRQQGERHEQQA